VTVNLRFTIALDHPTRTPGQCIGNGSNKGINWRYRKRHTIDWRTCYLFVRMSAEGHGLRDE